MSRVCDEDYERHLNNYMESIYSYNELTEDSFLKHIDPFIRHNAMQEQSFCWAESSRINFSPTLTKNGLCYTFNGMKSFLNQKM